MRYTVHDELVSMAAAELRVALWGCMKFSTAVDDPDVRVCEGGVVP
jgi:hypothetical protein